MNRKEILEKHPPVMENMLLILHDLQNHSPRNYLSEKDMTLVADYLNTTRGQVYGVASYYTLFSLTPRGKHIIRICRSPVCHVTGAVDLLAHLTATLGIGMGQTTADGLFTLETAECLGQCEQAPAMAVDTETYGNLTPGKIEKVLNAYRLKKHRFKRKAGT